MIWFSRRLIVPEPLWVSLCKVAANHRDLPITETNEDLQWVTHNRYYGNLVSRERIRNTILG